MKHESPWWRSKCIHCGAFRSQWITGTCEGDEEYRRKAQEKKPRAEFGDGVDYRYGATSKWSGWIGGWGEEGSLVPLLFVVSGHSCLHPWGPGIYKKRGV